MIPVLKMDAVYYKKSLCLSGLMTWERSAFRSGYLIPGCVANYLIFYSSRSRSISGRNYVSISHSRTTRHLLYYDHVPVQYAKLGF